MTITKFNRIGVLEKFTKEEFSLYEPNCRPGGRPDANHNNCPLFGASEGSDEGFIDSKESLREVAERDDAQVRKILGDHGHEMIAFKLKHVGKIPQFDEPKGAPKWFTDFDIPKGTFTVSSIEYMGYQGCPFWKEGIINEDGQSKEIIFPCHARSDGDHTITNNMLGKTIQASQLLPHLILYHHFYEGNVAYRIPPEELIEVLEIRASEFDGFDWDLIKRDPYGVFVNYPQTV